MDNKGDLDQIILKDAKHPFWLGGKKPINNLLELKSTLEEIDENSFSNHVNSKKHDFATWIKHSLDNHELAEVISKIDNKQDLIIFLDSYGQSSFEEKDTTKNEDVNKKISDDKEDDSENFLSEIEKEREKLEKLIPEGNNDSKDDTPKKDEKIESELPPIESPENLFNVPEGEKEEDNNFMNQDEENANFEIPESSNLFTDKNEGSIKDSSTQKNDAINHMNEETPELFIPKPEDPSDMKVAEKNVAKPKGFLARLFKKKQKEEKVEPSPVDQTEDQSNRKMAPQLPSDSNPDESSQDIFSYNPEKDLGQTPEEIPQLGIEDIKEGLNEIDIPKPEDFENKDKKEEEEMTPPSIENVNLGEPSLFQEEKINDKPSEDQTENQDIFEQKEEEIQPPSLEKPILPSKDEFFHTDEDNKPSEDVSKDNQNDDSANIGENIIDSENVFVMDDKPVMENSKENEEDHKSNQEQDSPSNSKNLFENVEETKQNEEINDANKETEIIEESPKIEDSNKLMEDIPIPQEQTEETPKIEESTDSAEPIEAPVPEQADLEQKPEENVENTDSVDDLKDLVGKNSDDIEKIVNELEDKNKEIESLKETIENLKSEKNSNNDLFEKTKEDLAKKEQDFIELENDFDNKKIELEKELNELSSQKVDMESLDNKRKELEDLENKKKELDEANKNLEAEKNSLSIKSDLLQKNKDAYENLKRKLDNEIREREERLKELEADFSKKNEFAEKKIAELKTLELELEYKEKELKEKEKVVEKDRFQLSDKEISINSKEDRLNTLYDEYDQKQKELDKKEEDLVKLIKDAELDKETLKKDKEELSSKQKQFDENIKNQKDEIESLKKDLEKRKNELDLKEKELNMADNALDYAMKEYNEKKDDLDDDEFHKYLHDKLNELSNHDDVMKTASKNFNVNDKYVSEIQKINNQIDSCRTLIGKKDFDSAKEIYNKIRKSYYESDLSESEKENIHNDIRDLYDEINIGMLNK
ncbi:hypothetical protein C0585_06910 [Candidatus Woesearchaeota archaeon]|nr:MAG: hypothetical protein C0585_06910 [Candidatus Woesearchaeota archaeon]